jgi:hypothetical protein
VGGIVSTSVLPSLKVIWRGAGRPKLVCKPVKKPPNECVGLVKLNVAAPSGKPSQFWLGPRC